MYIINLRFYDLVSIGPFYSKETAQTYLDYHYDDSYRPEIIHMMAPMLDYQAVDSLGYVDTAATLNKKGE